MYISESVLQHLVSKAAKQVINEYMMGGQDYYDLYNIYKSRNNVDPKFDELWIELHTLGQYADDLFNLAEHNKKGKSTADMDQKTAMYVYDELLSPIYGFMSNRTPRKKDNHNPSVNDLMDLSDDLYKLYNYCRNNRKISLLNFFASVSKRAYDASNELVEKIEEENL